MGSSKTKEELQDRVVVTKDRHRETGRCALMNTEFWSDGRKKSERSTVDLLTMKTALYFWNLMRVNIFFCSHHEKIKWARKCMR